VNQLRFLQLIAELDFAGPARVIGPNRRSVTGRAIVRHASVPFECTLERDLLVILDFDSSVQPIGAHPSCAEATHEYASSVIKWRVQLLGGSHSAARCEMSAGESLNPEITELVRHVWGKIVREGQARQRRYCRLGAFRERS